MENVQHTSLAQQLLDDWDGGVEEKEMGLDSDSGKALVKTHSSLESRNMQIDATSGPQSIGIVIPITFHSTTNGPCSGIEGYSK
jgi:hypothetical protein